MYSIDLKKISLDEFSEILHSIDLLPGRRLLMNNLDKTIKKLKKMDIINLFDLKIMLKKKSDYPEISKALSVDTGYLTILNREINSYESKPVPLDKLEVFLKNEISLLAENKIKTTKDLYDRCWNRIKRAAFSKEMKIDISKILKALELTDMLRVNGVGMIYASILNKIGIKSVSDYLDAGSEEILKRFQKINENKSLTKAKLGLKDVEYCKRFCKKLDKEIEW
jgi:hypothetical protein